VQRNVKREFTQLADQCLTASEENVVKFELLLRLRQASQHPQLVLNGFSRKYKRSFGKWLNKETGEPLASSKHLHLLEMLKGHPEESAIVFCQFTEEMNILEQLLADNGFPCLRLDGSMNSAQRQEMLQQCGGSVVNNRQTLRAGDAGASLPRSLMKMIGDYLRPPTTLIQIKAGGVGLNLQAFSRVYINSPDWNPCNEIQAMARSHRLGQTRKVVVKRLAIEAPEGETVIDDRIMGVQETKRNLMADLLNEEELRCNGRRQTGKVGLTSNDFKKLLKC
jgi:SNF2 family DNA or RNA helicase